MRILLVGGTSSLARSLQPLLAPFAEVTTAGRHGCDLELDLTGGVTIPSGFDVVINTAAHFGGNSAEDMLEAERVNVIGALRLCSASRESGASRFVQVSSMFAELQPASPFFNSYSLTKRQGEEITRLYAARHGLALAIVRPSQMYGSGDAHRQKQPFLYALMDKASNNEDIVFHGTHDAERNFIHVDDVAQVLALTVMQGVEGTYNCAYPEDVGYSRVARAAIAAFGSSSTVRFDEAMPDIPDNVFPMDNSLYEKLGFTPAISIEAGMHKEATERGAA